jgi:hypothetical protein
MPSTEVRVVIAGPEEAAGMTNPPHARRSPLQGSSVRAADESLSRTSNDRAPESSEIVVVPNAVVMRTIEPTVKGKSSEGTPQSALVMEAPVESEKVSSKQPSALGVASVRTCLDRGRAASSEMAPRAAVHVEGASSDTGVVVIRAEPTSNADSVKRSARVSSSVRPPELSGMNIVVESKSTM